MGGGQDRAGEVEAGAKSETEAGVDVVSGTALKVAIEAETEAAVEAK